MSLNLVSSYESVFDCFNAHTVQATHAENQPGEIDCNASIPLHDHDNENCQNSGDDAPQLPEKPGNSPNDAMADVLMPPPDESCNSKPCIIIIPHQYNNIHPDAPASEDPGKIHSASQSGRCSPYILHLVDLSVAQPSHRLENESDVEVNSNVNQPEASTTGVIASLAKV